MLLSPASTRAARNGRDLPWEESWKERAAIQHDPPWPRCVMDCRSQNVVAKDAVQSRLLSNTPKGRTPSILSAAAAGNRRDKELIEQFDSP